MYLKVDGFVVRFNYCFVYFAIEFLEVISDLIIVCLSKKKKKNSLHQSIRSYSYNNKKRASNKRKA